MDRGHGDSRARAARLPGPGGEAPHRVLGLDPRAQLAWLGVVLFVALFGGDRGLLAASLAALLGLAYAGAWRDWLRLALGLAPLALMVALLDAGSGQVGEGLRSAARLVVLASTGLAFTHLASGEQLAAGLRALRVPYAIVFALVAGARFVPTVTADLASLRDAARLRGIRLDGPPWVQLGGWRRLLVPLVVGSVRRGLQVGEAMEARAFGARPRRSTRHQLRWGTVDTLGLLVACVFAVLVFALQP